MDSINGDECRFYLYGDEMNIGEFMSQKDEIERLNNQINMMADFYSVFYKDIVLKSERLLKRHREMRYKEKARRVALESKSISSLTCLLRLSEKGVITLTKKDMAAVCFVSLTEVYKTQKRM